MSNVTTPITRAEVKARLDNFSHHWRERIDGWKADSTGHTEKSYAQQLWSDLFRCFGIIPERIDLFERDAARASTGNTGYIDLFWSGVVLGEAKSLGKDLDVAFDQALDYLAGGSIADHEFPKYVIVSDFEHFRLTRLGDESWTVRFSIDEISSYLDQLRFLAGFETVTKQEEAEASIFASRIMADLFTAMVGDDVDEPVGDEAPTDPEDEDQAVQETSMYLTRLLFLLYGDDAGLWEEDLFYRFVLHHTNDENLGSQLNALFEVLNTPESKRRRVPDSLAKFPYVNGSIFEQSMATRYFDKDMRDALLSACRFHWSNISPAVFGSMFQLVKSKEARRADGEHYTSEKNILKTIEPLFLDELRDEAKRLMALADTTANLRKIRDFRDSLSEMIFCDPACGCGNFLVVAYRELRAIETEIIVEIRRREGQTGMSLDVSWEQKLNIGQFHGFELNWWPAKIAETAMFLVDHQANRELAEAIGSAPDRLPIEITAHITHGNALELDWSEILPEVSGEAYVFGNPPFIGKSAKAKDQVDDLKTVWGKDYTGYLDYVTGWHAKSLEFYKERSGEFAFVTTNSITQGQPVATLFGPIFEKGWRIKFGHRTFGWDSEAPGKAAVHVVIIGFSRRDDFTPRLWDYPTLSGNPVPATVSRGINGYLVDGPNVLVGRRNQPLSPVINPASTGAYPADGGNFTVEKNELEDVLKDKIATKYLRPYKGSKEIVNNLERWCLWLRDIDPADIQNSRILQERLDGVRKFREKSKNPGTLAMANRPNEFVFDGSRDTDYLAIPSVVSSNRRYFTVQRLPSEVIVTNLAFTVEDPDGFHFAIASSSMFITWQKTIGGRLKSDLRFGNTTTWNNLPIPELSEEARAEIVEAGKKVLFARELFPDRSLAEHYNSFAMDRDLLKAHNDLDRVVDKAMGATRKLTTERQRQELLFQNYVRLTSQ